LATGPIRNREFPSPVQIAQARARWRGLARHLCGRLAVPLGRGVKSALFSSGTRFRSQEKMKLISRFILATGMVFLPHLVQAQISITGGVNNDVAPVQSDSIVKLAAADRLRDQLIQAGYILKDTEQGYQITAAK